MKRFSKGLFLVIVVISLMIIGCTKNSVNPNGSLGGTPGGTQTTFVVQLSSSASLGNYLVDKDGYSLYSFSDDYQGMNTCSGACAALWPYFYAGPLTTANLGNGLNLSDFGTVTVGSVTQTTYKGWPLYYYAPVPGGAYAGSSNVRESPGQIGGDGYNNIWFVAKPDYSIFLADGQLVGNNGLNYLDTYLPGNGKTLYFTDSKGITLYTYSHDSAGINKFTHADFLNNPNWPIYDTTLIVVPSVLDKTLFATTTVFGRKQLTYNGWPLYYFGSDANVMGNNKGVSIGAKPGVWSVPEMNTLPAPHK